MRDKGMHSTTSFFLEYVDILKDGLTIKII